jgi:hypothetical protein
MAIQQIEISNTQGTKGIEKEISKGAKKMVLDTLQINQYTKPVESTVRELASNAVDAQLEKRIAKEILSGEAQVEDYFISRTGEKYEDSNWKPDYYDLTWLSDDDNVYLNYYEGSGGGFCDTFEVIDHGVGVGESRLYGYFQLGYSTKRNSASALGAWGFGNKVALSTRCKYYTVETAYNGKLFKFNCYAYKIDSLVPKFDLETEEENNFVEWDNGAKIYYQATDSKNYTKINVPVKRHNRRSFEDAVSSQLLYFENILFKTIEEDGYERPHEFRASLAYESDNIIISDSYHYGKPHVLVCKPDSNIGVCYGVIDFKELELEDIYANVAIKCPIRSVIEDEATGEDIVLNEGVEVTSSRESIVWSDHTKNFILKKIQDVRDEAEELVKEELKLDDFPTWVNTCVSLITNAESTSVIGRIGKFVSLNSLKPAFPGNKKLRYSTFEKFFKGLNVRLVSYNGKKINREDCLSWYTYINRPIYVGTISAVNNRDYYITQAQEKGSFILITPDNKTPDITGLELERYREHQELLWSVLEDSYINYDEIEVSEDYKKSYERLEQHDILNRTLTPEEWRVQNQMITIRSYDSTRKSYDYTYNEYSLSLQNHEERLADLVNYSGNLYYGFTEDKEKLRFASKILKNEYNFHLYNDECVILIAKKYEKYFKHHKYIDEFFETVEDGVLTAHSRMIHGYTIYKLQKEDHEMCQRVIRHKQCWYFMDRSAQAAKDLFENYYRSCPNYLNGNIKVDIFEHYNKLVEIQDAFESGDEDMIAEVQKQYNLPEEVKDCKIYDVMQTQVAYDINDIYTQYLHMLDCDLNIDDRTSEVSEYFKFKNYIDYKNDDYIKQDK